MRIPRAVAINPFLFQKTYQNFTGESVARRPTWICHPTCPCDLNKSRNMDYKDDSSARKRGLELPEPDDDNRPIEADRGKVRQRHLKCKKEANELLHYVPNTKEKTIYAFILAIKSAGLSDRLCSQDIMERLYENWTFRDESPCEFRKIVNCWKCNRSIRGAHLYLLKETRPSGLYIGYYPHGCSHVFYDGSPWCNGCCTLVKVEKTVFIFCTSCARINWGKGAKEGINYFAP